ncbi:MAG: hypothetical protein WBP12_05355 [Candidatus Saccharimonas sp.]
MSEPIEPRFKPSRRTVAYLRALELLTVIGIIIAIAMSGISWLGLILIVVLIADKLLDRQVRKVKTWQRAQWQWNESVVQSILLEASSISRIEKNLQLPTQFSVRLLNNHRLTITDQLWTRLGPGLGVRYEVRELDEELEYRNITPA